jgi:hypothetical protein
MCLTKLTLAAGAGALWLLGVTSLAPALAQSAQGKPYAPRPYARPRIEITPAPLLYRRCVERLELQYRPSGPVLYPLTYCWWVRG